jgi:AcrR family transcriptional regulator
MTADTQRPATLEGKDPEKRARILDAARTILRAKRYDDVPVSEITELAGIAKGTFYLYFPSKADLVAALAETIHEHIMANIVSALQTPRSFADLIEVMIRTAFTSLLEQRDLMNILELDLLLRHPFKTQDSHHDARRAAMVGMFEAGQHSGEIDPSVNAHVAAELVGGMMIPLARVFIFGAPDVDKEAYLSETIAFIQRGLGVTRAHPN